jgi:serine protease Do
MKILRSGKEYTIKVIIIEMPREVAEVVPDQLPDDTKAEVLTGLTVMDLTKEIVRQLGFSKDEKGVVVVKVELGSPADEADIKKGDIIKEIDKKGVDNLEDFNRIATNIKKKDTVLLFVNRGGKRFYVILKAS